MLETYKSVIVNMSMFYCHGIEGNIFIPFHNKPKNYSIVCVCDLCLHIFENEY